LSLASLSTKHVVVKVTWLATLHRVQFSGS